MAIQNKTDLLALVNANITTNGANGITGAELNAILTNLVDSGFNSIDDVHKLFRTYDPTKSYTVGLPCIYSAGIYQCTTATSGTFNPAHWTLLVGGSGSTNLAYTASPTNGIVTSDTGMDATLPLGDVTNAGLISPAQTAAITENTAKVSASGSINTHSDMDTETVAPVTNDGLVFNGTNFVPVQVWKKSVFEALTYSGSITWDYSTGYNKTLTLTGNTTLSLTNFTFGDSGMLIVTQDGTGGRTITFPAGSAYIRGTDAAAMLNTAPNAVTMLRFTSQGSNIWWEEMHTLPLGQKPYVTLTYGATTTVNASISNNAKVTLTGNTTLAITGARNGMSGEIIVIQNATGGWVISALPATSKIVEGTTVANLISTAANDTTILNWRFDGTTYFWDYGKNFA
jgi:hypothetical protein